MNPLCSTCGVGYYLPSSVCDHCDNARPDSALAADVLVEMALCETTRVFLKPNILYRFIVYPNCEACAKTAAAIYD